MAPTIPLDSIYTAEEAAERLRVTTRNVIKLGKKYGTCSMVGTKYLFSEEDLLRLWAAIRVEPATARSVLEPTQRVDAWFKDDLEWVFSRPRTLADRRVMGVLKQLYEHREPKTHKDLDRSGPRTIEMLLEKGLVVNCGTDSRGATLVKISDAGVEQIKIAERWAKKRRAHGKSDRWW